MSLKSFHILFINLATLLAVGVGVRELREYGRGAGTGALVLGVLCLALTAGLVVYGIRARRKLRGLGPEED